MAISRWNARPSPWRRCPSRFYLSATRYTTSSFMRLKLYDQLTSRGVAPHVYESRDEALRRLGDGVGDA